jgi:hypothetical protein
LRSPGEADDGGLPDRLQAMLARSAFRDSESGVSMHSEKKSLSALSRSAPGSSLALNRLLSRTATMSEHLDFIHAALDALESTARENPDSKSVLYRRNAINHARVRNVELVFHMLYAHLNEYLRNILREMYKKRPLEIINKHQGSLKFHEIVKLGSYDKICDKMVDDVFRTLETPSIRSTVRRLVGHTKVLKDDKPFRDMVMYIEMRNLLVHNS